MCLFEQRRASGITGAFIKKNPGARRLAVELVPSFVELVQQIAPVFTVPTFGNFLTVLTGWGHSWVVLCLIVEFPFRRGHYVSLPVLFRLYVHQKTAAGKRLRYRPQPEIGRRDARSPLLPTP